MLTGVAVTAGMSISFLTGVALGASVLIGSAGVAMCLRDVICVKDDAKDLPYCASCACEYKLVSEMEAGNLVKA